MPRILVIDDEEAVRSAVKRRLEREGHQVEVADSQAAGISALMDQGQPFDVVVTDMVMESPTSGLEVLEAALTADVFTEVIVLTAYGNVANAVECMRRGAIDYVEKNMPGVDVFELLSMRLAEALDRRRKTVASIRKMEMYSGLD